MRISKSILLIVRSCVLLTGCDGNGNKGILRTDEIAYIKNVLDPQLVKAGVCSSAKECDDNYDRYNTCLSGRALSCDIYGISDEKMIREILLSMLNSQLRVGQITFWGNLHGRGG